MNPTQFYSVPNAAAYYNPQYPNTPDCLIIDEHVLSIKADLDDIYKRQLKSDYAEGPKGDFAKRIAGIKMRDAARKFLQKLLLEKQSQFSISDCRNKIETKRQDESAGIFADTSASAETRILTESKTKQYSIIIVSSVIMLAVLVLTLRKKKS